AADSRSPSLCRRHTGDRDHGHLHRRQFPADTGARTPTHRGPCHSPRRLRKDTSVSTPQTGSLQDTGMLGIARASSYDSEYNRQEILLPDDWFVPSDGYRGVRTLVRWTYRLDRPCFHAPAQGMTVTLSAGNVPGRSRGDPDAAPLPAQAADPSAPPPQAP